LIRRNVVALGACENVEDCEASFIHAFSVTAPSAWNCLANNIHDLAIELHIFWRQLETIL